MHTIVRRLARNVHPPSRSVRNVHPVQPPHIRTFSASTRRHDPSRPMKTTKYIDALHRETRDPLWRLLDTLHAPARRLELSAALFHHGVSVDDFRAWKPVLHAPSIASALEALDAQGYLVCPPPGGKANIPPWVVLYLAGFKVRTPAHAQGPLQDMVYAYLDLVPPATQGPLLVFAMLHLARFGLVHPMFRVVDAFLAVPLTHHPALHFNLMLHALSTRPMRAVENATLAVSLLKAMEARQLALTPETHHALLNDRFVTLKLTMYLQERMVREGTVPTREQLEAYLRVFARDGAIHDAQRYFDAIHARPLEDPGEHMKDRANEPRYRANTLMLAAQPDRSSAFAFLRSLTKGSPEHLKLPAPTSSDHPKLPISLLPEKRPRLTHRPHIDVYDYTTTLLTAARDLSLPARRLLALFHRAPVRPSIATYTVLIRGLLWREQYALAETWWGKLLGANVPVDREALTVGFQVLTRVGKPHEAFALLEKYAGQGRVRLSTIAMNECLVALNRIRRPDAVFALWDTMGPLYGVLPNAVTLAILLQAARGAYRLDDTFTGAVEQLKLRNPFRRGEKEGEGEGGTREDAVKKVQQVLGRPGAPRAYRSGIWRSLPPIEAARRVFLQAMFTDAPYLLSVVPPAHAVRASLSSDTSLALSKKPIHTFTPPPDLLTTAHPSIRLTNSTCLSYLLLLSLTSLAPEIPYLLAWMRERGIEPSRSTLAVAMVLWGEVSLEAPLVEAWSGGRGRSEYVRLEEWVRAWVGEGRVPGERERARWRHVVVRVRERRY